MDAWMRQDASMPGLGSDTVKFRWEISCLVFASRDFFRCNWSH